MTSHRPLNSDEKDLLAQKLLDAKQADPELLREALPEVAHLLDGFSQPPESPSSSSGLIGLTSRERSFHEGELENLLSRVKSLTTAEAVVGLEHGANLLAENGFKPRPDLREDLLKLVRRATGIRPRKTGKQREKVLGEDDASRVVPVVRGLELHLTWEFKLVKVTLDPEQCQFRSRALSIIGLGQDVDGSTDVAASHDDYLSGAIGNG